MMRTTLYLPPELHFRLKTASQQNNRSVSQLVQTILDDGLKPFENHRVQAMYSALNRLKGIGTAPTTTVAAEIDNTLYGEDGAWRPTL